MNSRHVSGWSYFMETWSGSHPASQVGLHTLPAGEASSLRCSQSPHPLPLLHIPVLSPGFLQVLRTLIFLPLPPLAQNYSDWGKIHSPHLLTPAHSPLAPSSLVQNQDASIGHQILGVPCKPLQCSITAPMPHHSSYSWDRAFLYNMFGFSVLSLPPDTVSALGMGNLPIMSNCVLHPYSHVAHTRCSVNGVDAYYMNRAPSLVRHSWTLCLCFCPITNFSPRQSAIGTQEFLLDMRKSYNMFLQRTSLGGSI